MQGTSGTCGMFPAVSVEESGRGALALDTDTCWQGKTNKRTASETLQLRSRCVVLDSRPAALPTGSPVFKAGSSTGSSCDHKYQPAPDKWHSAAEPGDSVPLRVHSCLKAVVAFLIMY